LPEVSQLNAKDRANRRSHVRQLCSDFIEISFEDRRGFSVTQTGLMEDLTEQGVCVSMSLPLPVGQTVNVKTDGFSGEAFVRHCTLGDYGYLVGLELSKDCVWDPKQWQPKHLLTLPVPRK